jgi:thymidylate synthase ThyX
MNDKINPDSLYTFFGNIDKEVREKYLLDFINNKQSYKSYSLSYIFDKYQHKISKNVKDVYIKTLSRDNYKDFMERENKIELFNFLYIKLEENEKQNIEFYIENIEKSVKDMISFLIKKYDKYKILLIQLINNELALEYIISSLIINNLEIDLLKEIIKLKELEWNINSKISFRLDIFFIQKRY